MNNFDLLDRDNICNCSECPYNEDMQGHRYPCGQQNCWVKIHCDRAASFDDTDDDYDEYDDDDEYVD